MYKDLLVEIFADFGSADGKGKVSTGYSVAKDRILTARHGLYKDGSFANKVEVRWHYQRDKEGCNWQVVEIVDCGLDEGLDVALLKCTFPGQIHPSICFAFNNPGEAFNWESDGFAAAGKRNENRSPIPLAGEAYHAADEADWLHLTEKGKAEAPELWRGISGAPVFRKNSNELMGVIVECPNNFDAIRLYASPLWKLAGNTQFRNEIAKARELDLQQIRRDLKLILNDSPKLKETLAAEFRCSKDDLINTLIYGQADELLKHCEQAISKLKQNKEQAAISKGKALVNYLLPIVFDPHIIELICSQSRFGICRVEVGSNTVAEIVMAGKDGRATEYQPTEKDKDPVGVYLLDSPPANHGIGSDNWVTDFKRQIIEDFARLDELAVGQDQQLSPHEKLALAVDELEYCVEDKRTYYYLYRAPKDAAESAELAKAIDKLHQAFNGHVVFIECGGFDVIRKERRNINRPLTKILQTEVEETP
jgi:V8-like Glu-specific endopeptidase